MTFKSKIDPSTIDTDFPKLKQPNSVQGFRDNFAAIVANLSTASAEISTIQNKNIIVTGDITGISTYVGDNINSINLSLLLSDTGIQEGTYEVSSITVDSKGRITNIVDAAGVYLSQEGGTISGNLHLKSNLSIDDGMTVAGRNLVKDGNILDQLNTQNGVLVRQSDGLFTARTFHAADGLRVINENGVKGPVGYGIKGFTITFKGDIKGTAHIKSLEDTIITLKLDNENILSTTGGKMKGTLDLNDNYVKGAKQPIYGNHVGDRDFNDARYLRNTMGNATGLVVQRRIGTETIPREIKGHHGIYVVNGDGFDGNPTICAKHFKLSFRGDVIGSGTVNALSDTIIDLSLANHYTKDEADKIFFGKFANSIDSDLTLNGNLTIGSGSIHGRNIVNDGQTLDSLITSMGFVVSDGTRAHGRTLQGTGNQIIVKHGNGISSDPIIEICNNPIIPGHDGLTLPNGKTGQRSASNGKIRYNTDTVSVEVCQAGSWSNIQTASFGILSVEDTTLWMVNHTKTASLTLARDTILDVHGIVAGERYTLFLISGAKITFNHRFKFPADFVLPSNGLTIIEFVSDGNYLYAISKNSF